MTYSFKDKKTKKITTVEMKISEYDSYLAAHPKLEAYIDAPPRFTFNGRTFGGIDNQVPGGFKEVLQKIGEQNPYTELGDKYRKNKTNKEIKTRDVVRAYAKKQSKRERDSVK